MIASGSGVPTPQEPEITSDMISAGAKGLTGRSKSGDVYSIVVADSVMAIRIAEQVLSAALAGRTVLPLPEPNRRQDECGVDAGYWHLTEPGPRSEVTDVMSYEIDGEPWVYTGPGPDYAYTVAAMRERCLAGLAACADAERLASESRKDGETRECPAHGAHPHDGMKCLDCRLCVEGGVS